MRQALGVQLCRANQGYMKTRIALALLLACAAPAAAVVGESVVAFEVANAFLEKFGGDSLREIRRNYESYLEQIKNF